jgi:hypothetical protein
MDLGNEVNAQIALNSLGWETIKYKELKLMQINVHNFE